MYLVFASQVFVRLGGEPNGMARQQEEWKETRLSEYGERGGIRLVEGRLRWTKLERRRRTRQQGTRSSRN